MKVLLVQRASSLDVAAAVVREREGASRRGRKFVVANLDEEIQALFAELLRPLEVSLLDAGYAERVESLGRAPHVAKLAIERQRPLGDRFGRRRISAPVHHEGCSVESPGTGRGRTLLGRERALEAMPALGDVPTVVPEVGQSSCKLQDEFALP